MARHASPPHPTRPGRFAAALHSRPVLLVAFAFAVMADPVSSVAYAIEAALRALHGDLALLLPTMGLVVAVIALVIINYHYLVARYPQGGGAAAAAGDAFGEAWVLPGVRNEHEGGVEDEHEQGAVRAHGDAVMLILSVLIGRAGDRHWAHWSPETPC